MMPINASAYLLLGAKWIIRRAKYKLQPEQEIVSRPKALLRYCQMRASMFLMQKKLPMNPSPAVENSLCILVTIIKALG